MSSRYFGLNVFLEKPVVLEEVAAIIAAIRLIKGVSSVQPLLAHPEMFWAKERARSELSQAMMDALNRDSPSQEMDFVKQVIRHDFG